MENEVNGSSYGESSNPYEHIHKLVQSLSQQVSDTPGDTMNEEIILERLRDYTTQVCSMLERVEDSLYRGSLSGCFLR